MTDLVAFIEARVCCVEGCGRTGKITRRMCAKHYRYWLDHTPVEERGLPPRLQRDFWSNVTKRHEHGCWTWTGPMDRKGYGRWSKVLAHRHSWTLANGAIPEGMWILHHCDNPPCVNPSHLYVGTVVENVQDAIDRGRHHRPARQERCNRGHELAGDNLYVWTSRTGNVHHKCRTCDRARSVEWQRKARRARGITSRFLSEQEKVLVHQLAGEGVSQRRIARQVGRSYATVQRVLREGRE